MMQICVTLVTLAVLSPCTGLCFSIEYSTLKNSAQQLLEWQVGHRRFLHQHPELRYQEVYTSRYITKIIDNIKDELPQNVAEKVSVSFGWGVNKYFNTTISDEYAVIDNLSEGKGATGIVVDVGSGKRPCMALRADMDALPIEEEDITLAYRSQTANRMHACGHDAHMTMLVGALKVIAPHAESINGTVRFIFQPAEEGGLGAKRMIEEGVLSKIPPVEAIFGLHVAPHLPTGVIAGRPGSFFAGGDVLEIRISGQGGHAAAPHLAKDPLLAAAKAIDAMYSVVGREFNDGLVTITNLQADSSWNVIPASVRMGGTIRSWNKGTLERLKERVKEVVSSTANIYGCTGKAIYSAEGFPPVYNDKHLWKEFTLKTAATAATGGEVIEVEPFLGGEDFAFFSEVVPSNFLFIGIGGSPEKLMAPPTNYTLHSPRFNIDESVLPLGSAVLAHLAVQGILYLSSRESDGMRDQFHMEHDEL
eukprot:GHVQ01040590.1.p1 GENE.GHVQ01040590.1~~GHVQ01040590.1.p1  ORF type:complete len:476 (+),score=62.38 GHVQ01040590.1:139-1566(+)